MDTKEYDRIDKMITELLKDFVTIDKDFNVKKYRIAKYPVTQKLWQDVMGQNPSHFKGNNLPVESVSWNDCQGFIGKLNNLLALLRKNPGFEPRTGEFRLPTEKEWEYAAKGAYNKEEFTYAGSNTIGDVAWHEGNSDKKTHPVGRENNDVMTPKKPNSLGLYHMSGNVWEWCNYDSDKEASGEIKVLRGGAWNCDEKYCLVTCRYVNHHTSHHISPQIDPNSIGFRLVYIP